MIRDASTYVNQAGDSETKGEGDVNHRRWIVRGPRDAGRAADQHQEKRAEGLGEQLQQKLELHHLLQPDEVFHTWHGKQAKGKKKKWEMICYNCYNIIIILLWQLYL